MRFPIGENAMFLVGEVSGSPAHGRNHASHLAGDTVPDCGTRHQRGLGRAGSDILAG
jgi:hypothetical protein